MAASERMYILLYKYNTGRETKLILLHWQESWHLHVNDFIYVSIEGQIKN